MVIVETSVFTRQVQKLLTEDEYKQLQLALVERPEMGAIIKKSGGLRKARWKSRGRGKRGGVRVIYYWAVALEQILMLLIYAKSDQDELSQNQLQMLRQIVEVEYP